jgi:hypothetical protein
MHSSQIKIVTACRKAAGFNGIKSKQTDQDTGEVRIEFYGLCKLNCERI